MDAVPNTNKLATASTDGFSPPAKIAFVEPEDVIVRVNQQTQAATAAARGVSSEMLRYAGKRLHAHAEHLQCLADCRTPQSVMEQQVAFMLRSMNDFTQGASSIMSAGQPSSAVSIPRKA